MSTEKVVKDLAKQLRNVGPKLATKLVEARIDSPDKLRQLGV
jgi:DNA uptake protein ComE-like DNA-binding protein